MSRSFYTRYDERGDIEVVYLDDASVGDVGLSDDLEESLHKGGSVSVAGERGVVTGFSRDRDSVYVRFAKSTRKVPVEEVLPVR